MMEIEKLKSELLEYEISSSLLTLIPFPGKWLARHFIRKVERKLQRVAEARQFDTWRAWREAAGLSAGYHDFRKHRR